MSWLVAALRPLSVEISSGASSSPGTLMGAKYLHTHVILILKTPAKTRTRHARRHRSPTLRRRRVGGCELRMAELARAFRLPTALLATVSVACALRGSYTAGKAHAGRSMGCRAGRSRRWEGRRRQLGSDATTRGRTVRVAPPHAPRDLREQALGHCLLSVSCCLLRRCYSPCGPRAHQSPSGHWGGRSETIETSSHPSMHNG